MTNKRKIELRSSYEDLYIIENFIEELADVYELHQNYFGNILIAVNEAVKNAIKHGNKFNAQEKVEILFEEGNDFFAFTISDKGNGFDFSKIPSIQTMEKEGVFEPYRGIYLIHKLADEVQYLNKGNVVRLLFKIVEKNIPLSSERHNILTNYQKDTQKPVNINNLPKENQ